MRCYGLPLFFFLLVLIAAITLACGSPMSHVSPNCSSAQTGPNTSGILQSVTLCPVTADAQKYCGEVQFIAAGIYSTTPSPVTPLKAFWGACFVNSPTDAVAITSSGLAHCAVGSSGTYTVFASEPTMCNAVTACGGGCQVSGYAQLTCP